MTRFDAYSATTTSAKASHLLAYFSSLPIDFEMHQGKGFHTFGDRIGIRDSSTGTEFGSVMWGGKQGDRCMIEVKGEHTPAVVQNIRQDGLCHRVTRLDSCADFDQPGIFDDMAHKLTLIKRQNRLRGSKAGDWEDFPEEGRTLYLGSPKSPVRARLYEKGKQPEYRHLDKPDWVRLELQVRPEKEAKSTYSKITPLDAWGASPWSREAASLLLRNHVDPHPAGSVYRLPDEESALRWMCTQYGPLLTSLMGDCGSWEAVGLTIRDTIQEVKRARLKSRH
jgi:hypothetical protein